MNHTRIASEALRYRLRHVRSPLVDDTDWDTERMAAGCVAAADATVDRAIRRIGTAWSEAGLDPEALCRPWTDPAIEGLFVSRPDLVDALDDIVRVARVRRHSHNAA